MERNLCVPDSVSDDDIHRAWGHLFWNNAIERIEHRDSKKIIHLNAYHTELEDELAEDELAEILEIYDDLETEGTLRFCLMDASIGWWIYDKVGRLEHHNTLHFDVCFE